MIYNDDENQYSEVTSTLKQLPRINAPMHFEADLMRRINSGKLEPKRKGSFLDKILSPYRLVPSAALAIIAIIMLFVVDTSPVEQDDPLSLEPRIREDMIQTGSSGISIDEDMSSLAQENESRLMRRESSPVYEERESVPPSAQFTSTSYISKSGLNFRQINLSKEEQKKLNQLKEKIKQYLEHREPASK